MAPARLLIAASLALLAACQGTTSSPGVTLDGREFLSSSVRVIDIDHELVEGTRIRLTFADGQIGASVGCNLMGGSYAVQDGRIVFDGGSMTEMGCDDARHAQDDWLFGFLGSDPEFRLDGDELVLTSGDTVITLLDRQVADPERQLVGTRWTVDTIFSGEAASSVPDGAVAALEFDEDGQVAVEAGCNSGAGAYEVDGDRLRFTDVAMTEMACQGAAGQLEAAVLAVIGAGEVRFSIEGGSLTLMAGEVGIGLRGNGG